jgi:hypothetical protein
LFCGLNKLQLRSPRRQTGKHITIKATHTLAKGIAKPLELTNAERREQKACVEVFSRSLAFRQKELS